MTEQAWVVGGETIEPMEYSEFAENVLQWAHDRNLVHGSKPQDQLFKLVEEYGELCEATVSVGSFFLDAADAIGDCSVVIGVVAAQLDIPFERLTDDYMRLKREEGEASRSLLVGVCLGRLAKAIKNPNESLLWVEALMQEFIHTLIDAADSEDDYKRCLRLAWNEIKDRKGKMVDGVFVKET